MVRQPVSMGGIGRPRPGTTCRHRTKPVIIPLEDDIIVVYEKAAAAAKAAAIHIKKKVKEGKVKWSKNKKEGKLTELQKKEAVSSEADGAMKMN